MTNSPPVIRRETALDLPCALPLGGRRGQRPALGSVALIVAVSVAAALPALGCGTLPGLAHTSLADALDSDVAACDDGKADGCHAIGLKYAMAGGVQRDLAKAAHYFKRGCDAGGAASCTRLAGQLADGVALPRDPAAAVALYEKSCEVGDAEACLTLGNAYELGSLVDPERTRAFGYFRAALEVDWPACEQARDAAARWPRSSPGSTA